MRRLLSLYNDPRAGMFLALILMFGIAAGLFGFRLVIIVDTILLIVVFFTGSR